VEPHFGVYNWSKEDAGCFIYFIRIIGVATWNWGRFQEFFSIPLLRRCESMEFLFFLIKIAVVIGITRYMMPFTKVVVGDYLLNALDWKW
jgi:hypothetical protein